MRIFANANYNFIKWRWHALVLSVVLIWAGVATVFLRGLPLGIDFTGGTVLILEFQQPTTEQDIRNGLGPLSAGAIVQRFGLDTGRNEFMIRLPLTAADEEIAFGETGNQAERALQEANLGPFEVIGRDIVGPVIGRDLQRKGIWATLTALGGILLYIGIRFRFTFALGAIIATFHDILITVVLLTWFGYELSLNVIAGILTIAGYSVNDTIVVFDRVRENQRLLRRDPLDQIVNRSVNQTLGRTVITSGTTLLAVLSLFLFGGEVLRSFSFTMLVGVITGTYSTVFIAASIAIILSRAAAPVPTARRTEASRRARA